MADEEGVANDGGIAIEKMEKLCFFSVFSGLGKGGDSMEGGGGVLPPQNCGGNN
jgi:hypothetical protein